MLLILASSPASSTQGPAPAPIEAEPGVLRLANTDDPLAASDALETAFRIELHFPKFTDGRAFSQAFLLRRRLGYLGDLRATGDVLVDQLLQMRRSGFSSAVLRADQDLQVARQQLARFEALGGFYQGDAVRHAPGFRAPKSSGARP